MFGQNTIIYNRINKEVGKRGRVYDDQSFDYRKKTLDAKTMTELLPNLIREKGDANEFAEIVSSIADDITDLITREEEGCDDAEAYAYAETLRVLSRKLKATSLLMPERRVYFAGYLAALADQYYGLVEKRSEERLNSLIDTVKRKET